MDLGRKYRNGIESVCRKGIFLSIANVSVNSS